MRIPKSFCGRYRERHLRRLGVNLIKQKPATPVRRDGLLFYRDRRSLKAVNDRGYRVYYLFATCFAVHAYSVRLARSLFGFARPALSTAQPWSALPS